MLTRTSVLAVLGLAGLVSAQSSTTTERVLSTLNPQINVGPSLTPTIYDPTAPDAQDCPGYTASNVQEQANGFTADLNIAGPNCQAFGNDIAALTLAVQYQTAERLNVKIYPRYIVDSNYTRYFLPSYIVPEPEADGSTTADNSDLKFTWSNSPSFQFKINRASNDEELFSTYGHKIVYEDQFLELVTNMVDDYSIYGLAENAHDFLLGNNYTQTYWAVDAGNTVDYNSYGTFPFYQETRYNQAAKGYGGGGSSTTAHGVYARNAHGQEWLLRNNTVTYRTLGGSFDLYFISGQNADGSSSALTTISQYTTGCIGNPVMQQYWTFGFHQCRWGYENVSVMEEVVQGYKDANIPLECMWNDLDIYELYRDFTYANNTYPIAEFKPFIEGLHANNQHYVPIIDSNVYTPNPDNASDAYLPWSRGAALGTYIRDGESDFYYGTNWPGYSTWGDWLVQSSNDWWASECSIYHENIPFDGIWIDLSEASSFCIGSCGKGHLTENPLHPPFLLPNDEYQQDFRYPEGFNVSNATEASAASSSSASQSSVVATLTLLPPTTTSTQGRTEPTPGVRNLNYPPYVINNVRAGHALGVGAIEPNATHNDPSNTTEYEMHNLFGLGISNATYHALLDIFPGKRPFTIGRSTFASSGKVTGHWGGDNTSTFGSMFLSISQALTFMMNGIPMFGVDTCGFAGNTDFDLCSRWMELSAFFPFYRNHNIKAALAQEAYLWSSVAEASRRVMAVRYSMLTYMYTLFHYANTKGETVMRALAWEFPEDESLKATFAQFMLGPAILVTPVLIPNADTVNGVFPGIGQGTRWFDWYTLDEMHAAPQENVTLSAPLEHINVHLRGGTVMVLQEPKYSTEETRNTPYSILIALDPNGAATGSLYLDDGESLVPPATRLVDFSFQDNCLRSSSTGSYHAAQPLSTITIAGVSQPPTGLTLHIGGQACEVGELVLTTVGSKVTVTGLEKFTGAGAFQGPIEMHLLY